MKKFLIEFDEQAMEELKEVMQTVDWENDNPSNADVIKELFFIEDGGEAYFRDQVKVVEIGVVDERLKGT